MNRLSETEKEALRRENIRPCGTFLPEEYVIRVERRPDTGESEPREELYLPANARLKWFLTYCQENGIKYRVDESDAEYVPALSCIKAVCHIWMDGEIAADGSAGYYLDKTAPRDEVQKAFQTAATAARGRALALLGFNLTGEFALSDTDNCDPVGRIPPAETPAEEPKKRTRKKKERTEETSAVTAEEAELRAEEKTESEAPAGTAGSGADGVPTTYDEAVAYPVPDRFRASLPATVGEALAAGKTRELEYFAKNSGRYPEFSAFCEAAALALRGDPYEGIMNTECPF